MNHAIDSRGTQVTPVPAESLSNPPLAEVSDGGDADPLGDRDPQAMVGRAVGQVKKDETPPDDFAAAIVHPAELDRFSHPQ